MKILFFGLLATYLLYCFVSRKFKINWPLTLIGVALHAVYFFGWKGILFMLAVAVISTTAELISLKTPFNVFGVTYKYNLKQRAFPSGIVLGSVYPIEVTAAWIYLKYLAFFIASISFLPLGVNGFTVALISAAMLTSFDFIIDPYSVSEGAWQWQKKGVFFGIPWQNFLGWFLVGLIISTLFMDMQPIRHDLSMTIIALAACAIGPLTLGGKLFKLNKVQAILALIPASAFIAFGVFSAFTNF